MRFCNALRRKYDGEVKRGAVRCDTEVRVYEHRDDKNEPNNKFSVLRSTADVHHLIYHRFTEHICNRVTVGHTPRARGQGYIMGRSISCCAVRGYEHSTKPHHDWLANHTWGICNLKGWER